MCTIAPSMPPHGFPRQRCRRPTLRSCAAGANGTNMRQRWSARSNAMTNNSNLSKVYSCEGSLTSYNEKVGYIDSAPLYICRVVLFLLRKRRGAGLGELQRARGRSKHIATVPAHT